eukprot:CAMPEP_0119113312 /NCGR_PEP_ID=MMETSP1180-20130426/43503_1 /TAXON_ID=3052 ORGANISM="Chlamydomonas cf sp, Strain CCMP681" /NCGR_SAMPLE_ID=MMETSP1180 /ASSEMBLY_ACC=CAM_ASM_000741 /LENGTH=72 /DNA_ID=CAMNT_0007101295 /DNA_START=293 /DNA_END=509 /DNA_ORIENTATION=+
MAGGKSEVQLLGSLSWRLGMSSTPPPPSAPVVMGDYGGAPGKGPRAGALRRKARETETVPGDASLGSAAAAP